MDTYLSSQPFTTEITVTLISRHAHSHTQRKPNGTTLRAHTEWPFRCCSTWRPPHTLTEHGSPISRATPPSTPNSRSTLSSTEAGTPPGAQQDDQEVCEVAPPTPGAHVTKDPEDPYMPTPVRANQVATTTPADSAKKAGNNDDHPINLN